MIDSADDSQVQESKMEFYNLLIHNELKDAVILVLANKSDLPTARSEAELVNIYGLHEVKQHDWHI